MDKATGGGMGLVTVLGLVFVVLKLTGEIDWPWLWVLAPFWVPIVVGVALLGVGAIFIRSGKKRRARSWRRDE